MNNYHCKCNCNKTRLQQPGTRSVHPVVPYHRTRTYTHTHTMTTTFKEDHSLDSRLAESDRIRKKYPDRIPVIVERAKKSDLPEIDRKKYLVPSDLTVGQFVYVIRRRINLSQEKAIFIYVNNVLPPTAQLMSTLYTEQKDQDGFLYILYSGENYFGAVEEADQ